MLRFAPSPTGDLHIGNLRVALFNYIVAKQKNKRFIVRIEDTDQARNVEGKDKEILEILKLFGIEYDDLIYQSKNLHFHQNLAFKLLEEGKAFVCFCSEEELEKEREKAKKERRPYRYSGKCENLTLKEASQRRGKFVIRVKKPATPIKFRDLIKGEQQFSPFEVDSFVILRSNGMPTYNFACAIDDMLSDIELIIRGEDHLSNTPKQIHIRNLLGYTKEVEYAHLPIILNEEGKKMSKRDKASSVKWLLEEGFLPQAIINYLILLGNQTPQEVFTLQEAIEWFDIGKLSKTSAKFDLAKLRFLNRKHLEKLDPKLLAQKIGVKEELGELVKLYLEEASTLKELKEKIRKVLEEKREFGEFKREAQELKEIIAQLELPTEFEEFKKEVMKRSSLKGKRFFKPLRLILSGADKGPEISLLYRHLRPEIKELIKL
ncbi:MAG: glutamate--tRNA ligase [Epsilonproteobacteria bacterium]|nr:glutamate--tRNA ligase [Campylobacterota bacterium]